MMKLIDLEALFAIVTNLVNIKYGTMCISSVGMNSSYEQQQEQKVAFILD